jgi:hypothetical protein
MKSISEIIERVDHSISIVSGVAVLSDEEWRTLKSAVLSQPAHNKQSTPCPAFAKGEHCTVLRVAMCPDEPCDLSRARA